MAPRTRIKARGCVSSLPSPEYRSSTPPGGLSGRRNEPLRGTHVPPYLPCLSACAEGKGEVFCPARLPPSVRERAGPERPGDEMSPGRTGEEGGTERDGVPLLPPSLDLISRLPRLAGMRTFVRQWALPVHP